LCSDDSWMNTVSPVCVLKCGWCCCCVLFCFWINFHLVAAAADALQQLNVGQMRENDETNVQVPTPTKSSPPMSIPKVCFKKELNNVIHLFIGLL
jgi:hypothetical protein